MSAHALCRLLVAVCAALSVGQAQDDAAAPKWKDVVTVDHSYYRMHLYKNNGEGSFDKHHVDMSNSRVHDFLSQHSQAAEAVAPGFEFPFYGHNVDRFFITTHGFLSFAPRLHNLMYKTQYIAPLRVKLDPSLSEFATLNYLSLADRLTIQWTNVTVAKPYAHPLGGNFTFQVTLHKNGDIDFVYVEVPELLTADALYDHEPVAGLSDAFLIGDNELHVYHTLNVENPDIMTKTVVLFRAKPTCIQQQSCEECSSLRAGSGFDCAWCPKLHRCSDGADRLREHWDSAECPLSNVSSAEACSQSGSHHTEWRSSMNVDDRETGVSSHEVSEIDVATVISALVSVVLVLVLLGLLAGFVYLYGRHNPGGIAERIAMRMERNYKRFGVNADVEMDKTNSAKDEAEDKTKQSNNNNNNNNNNITVSF